MSKEQFMKELEYLLQDIPEEEKEDALEYYRDYLEEAGEKEEQALKEFGSPERIAAMIRADIAGHLEHGGEFTDHGYEDARFRDPNYQVARRYDLPETFHRNSGQDNVQEDHDENGRNRGNHFAQENKTSVQKEFSWGKLILAGVLILIASPILIGIGGGLLGILAGLLGVLTAAVIGIGALTLALFLGGIVCIGTGIIAGIGGVGGSVLAIGTGMLILGLSLLGVAVSVLFYGKFLPWLLCSTVNIVSSWIHRKGDHS